MGLLESLFTALEAAANDHAEQVSDGVCVGLKSDACHVLTCLKLTHPEVDQDEAMTNGGADECYDDTMSEMEDLGDHVISFMKSKLSCDICYNK